MAQKIHEKPRKKAPPSAGKNGAPPARKRKGAKAEVIIPLHKTKKELRIERIEKWMKKHLPPAGTPEWEALCTGCGKCCFDKVWRGKRLLLLTSACGFLDKETNQCQIYAERFEQEPMCMPIGPEIIEMGGLPEDCPYVENLPGYLGPIPVDKTLDEM